MADFEKTMKNDSFYSVRYECSTDKEKYLYFLTNAQDQKVNFYVTAILQFLNSDQSLKIKEKDLLLKAFRKEFFYFRLKVIMDREIKVHGPTSSKYKEAESRMIASIDAKRPSTMAGATSTWKQSATDARMIIDGIVAFKDKAPYDETEIRTLMHELIEVELKKRRVSVEEPIEDEVEDEQLDVPVDVNQRKKDIKKMYAALSKCQKLGLLKIDGIEDLREGNTEFVSIEVDSDWKDKFQ
jgi:hypothetical protein